MEIQSSTLERLLEALDVRHLAGWYHPAMRLQEHLNVVQGSNAELRDQLKQLRYTNRILIAVRRSEQMSLKTNNYRKELQKKDNILHTLALNKNTNIEKICAEESDSEKMAMCLSEMKKLQEAYEDEADEWKRQKESLVQQNDELMGEIEKLKLQVEVCEQSLKIFEESEDEVRKAFAIKTKEYIEVAGEAFIGSRKIAALEQLLNRETMKAYQDQKEAIKNESYLRKALVDANNHNKILEREISTLQSNLSNSVSNATYKELKEKHEELSIRYRCQLENNAALQNDQVAQTLKTELALVEQEKNQLVELLQKEFSQESAQDLMLQLKEAKANELLEKQRADHVTSLHKILQVQLSKYEENIKEVAAAKSELQEELIILHKRLSKDVCFETAEVLDDNKVQELKDNNTALQVENENLKKLLQVSEEEAERQYSLNSLMILELDSLRHQIIDLQAASEDKATISRLGFELTSRKLSEMELNAQKVRLESELSNLQEELDKLRTTCEGWRTYVQDSRKQCDNRCR